jgi:hypothetical protein
MDILQSTKSLIKSTFLYDWFRSNQQNNEYRKWITAGKNGPTPHIAKQLVMKEYAKKYNTRIFVETGTFLGDMIYAMKDSFDRLYSIELAPDLFNRAKRRFAGDKRIIILQGDSATVLPGILAQVNEPCLFWLDGHYSGGSTAKGKTDTPVEEELKRILDHPIKTHVIIIDDARWFTGEGDYPSIEDLRRIVATAKPPKTIEVKDDMIRIV